MPIDLSLARGHHAYPQRMRFWPWATTWLICNVFGTAIVLLVWQKGEPASGIRFWSWLVGAPNVLFLVLLVFGRMGYEALWYRAYWRNHHRNRWLAEKIRFAQRPLHVLGAAYCLPLGGKSLSDILAGKRTILKKQAPRHSAGKVWCNRFEDADPLLTAASHAGDEEDQFNVEATATRIAPAVQMIRIALEPLVGTIRALSRYERSWWPQVRVLAEPDTASLRVTQVRDALQLAALAPLEIQAVPAVDGLMAVDAWLDARAYRPLLLLSAAWYDDDIDEGLAEGCVAVLLDAGYFKLPPEVSPKAVLHRPVASDAAEPERGFATAAIWGKSDAAAVTAAWISRPVKNCDRALNDAGFVTAAKDTAQRRLDRLVGDLGAANGLLAIAVAVESGLADGPQLVVDGLQSAILHLTPEDQTASTHDDTQK